MSTRKKVAIGAALVVCAPAFIAGAVAGVRQSGESTTPAAASSPTEPHTAQPSPAGPTFTYPGTRQCAIAYRDNGDGTMSWTVTTTTAGEIITHAGSASGSIYRHDQHIPAGPTRFTAPLPLAQVDDIGGNLDTSTGSYGCSVAPAR